MNKIFAASLQLFVRSLALLSLHPRQHGGGSRSDFDGVRAPSPTLMLVLTATRSRVWRSSTDQLTVLGQRRKRPAILYSTAAYIDLNLLAQLRRAADGLWARTRGRTEAPGHNSNLTL